MGIPVTITVDDLNLMSNVNMDDEWRMFFGNRGDDGSLWGPILEKAIAKLYGNYEMIVARSVHMGVNHITGAPCEADKKHDSMSGDDLFDLITSETQKKTVMMTVTRGEH